MNVAEAKAKLSELLDAASAGEHVVIARAGTPVATLNPIRPAAERTLGFLPIEVEDSFFAAFDGDDLADWQ